MSSTQRERRVLEPTPNFNRYGDREHSAEAAGRAAACRARVIDPGLTAYSLSCLNCAAGDRTL